MFIISNKETNDINIKDVIIEKFYQKLWALKRSLNVEKHRIYSVDCLMRKVKLNVFKAIHEGLQTCQKLFVPLLPRNFCTNIKISFNKIYLNKTVEEIYSNFNLFPKYNELKEHNLINNGKEIYIKELMCSKLSDIFDNYVLSDMFIYDKNECIRIYGEKYGCLYHYMAVNLTVYFKYSKAKSNR